MPIDSARAYDLAFGDFRIVRADERVVGAAGPLKLGRKAYRLLLMLAEQNGQLLTKDALFASVWDGTIVTESALTSAVKELRRALGDQSVDPIYIQSVYGRGYRLIPPVQLCPARDASATPTKTGRAVSNARPPLGDPPSLLMLPFDDGAVAASHPHLPAVLHEELLIALSRFREIRLVSDVEGGRTAGTAGPRDYRLTMRLILQGETLQAFIRISRQLSGTIVWAEQISLPARDAMVMVEATARRVAAFAMPRLREDMLRDLPHRPATGYDDYFINRQRMRDLDRLDEAKAVVASWERLIADHPDLLQAYPPLIRLYNTDYSFTGPGATGAEDRRRAYDLAHRAIAIDPTDSHLHTVKAWCHLWANEPGLAQRHFDEALRLNPYHQERLVEIATGLMFLDDLDRAAELLERCRSLAVFAGDIPQEEEGLLALLRQDYRRAADALVLAQWVHPDDRIRSRPGLLTGLYGLLAAAGADDEELAVRAHRWRDQLTERWSKDDPPGDEAIQDWIAFHNPFQQPERRAWLDELAGRAISAAASAPSTPLPAHGERPSVSG